MQSLLATDYQCIKITQLTMYKIIIIIIKGIYRAQDRPKATSAVCQQRNCQLFTCEPSTYYQQLNRNVFSCVLKVSTDNAQIHLMLYLVSNCLRLLYNSYSAASIQLIYTKYKVGQKRDCFSELKTNFRCFMTYTNSAMNI